MKCVIERKVGCLIEMSKLPETTILIIDACVLIDYFKSDRSILGLISHYVGRLQVVEDVLDEVEQLGYEELESLGMQLVEPGLDILIEAEATEENISFQDSLCFLLAKQNGWTCLSNDRKLRAACEAYGITVMWGLEPMKELVRKGKLGASEAIEVAKAIHESNPFFITTQIIEKFTKEVKGLTR